MKCFTILILTIGFQLTNIFAQDAKSILGKVSEKNKTYTTIEGSFKYILNNKTANVNEVSQGKFCIKGDKYKISILGTVKYFDGKNIYSFIVDSGEVTIQSAEDMDDTEDDLLKPSSIFNIYQKGFSYKYLGQKIYKGKKIYVIDLLPKDDTKEYYKVQLKIDKATYNIVEMETYGKSGDNVSIEIISMNTNANIPDKNFTFDTKAHPNVEVIDMR